MTGCPGGLHRARRFGPPSPGWPASSVSHIVLSTAAHRAGSSADPIPPCEPPRSVGGGWSGDVPALAKGKVRAG